MTVITESRPLVESVNSVSAKKMRVRIIEGNRWGSSGYYSESMLIRDGAVAFPAGTQMYLDHPSESEEFDRPERSVRDLAGKLLTDAVYEKDGLYADVQIYDHMAPVISAIAEDVGLSIRAKAVAEKGKVGNRTGTIIKKITEGISVDFVTRAGAGGKVVQLLESARAEAQKLEEESKVKEGESETEVKEARNLGQWIESMIHLRFTEMADHMAADGRLTREERIALSNAIGDGLEAFVSKVESEIPQLYSRDIWEEPQAATAEEAEKDVPGNPPADPTTPIKESSVADTTISESRLRELEESAKKVDSLETQLSEARSETKKALVESAKETIRANEAEAKLVVWKLMDKAGVKGDKLAEALAKNPPLGEDGRVDEKALIESVKESLGEISVSVDESRGGVRGFGEGEGEAEVTEADVDRKIAQLFNREVKA